MSSADAAYGAGMASRNQSLWRRTALGVLSYVMPGTDIDDVRTDVGNSATAYAMSGTHIGWHGTDIP
eukprot:1851715-Rhodomonas_salina.1